MKKNTQDIPLDINIGYIMNEDGSYSENIGIALRQGSMHFTVVIPAKNIGAFQEVVLDGINTALISRTLHVVKD